MADTNARSMEQVYKILGQTMHVNTQITSHSYSPTSDILWNYGSKCNKLSPVVLICPVWFFQRFQKLGKRSLNFLLLLGLSTHGSDGILRVCLIDPERHCTTFLPSCSLLILVDGSAASMCKPTAGARCRFWLKFWLKSSQIMLKFLT